MTPGVLPGIPIQDPQFLQQVPPVTRSLSLRDLIQVSSVPISEGMCQKAVFGARVSRSQGSLMLTWLPLPVRDEPAVYQNGTRKFGRRVWFTIYFIDTGGKDIFVDACGTINIYPHQQCLTEAE